MQEKKLGGGGGGRGGDTRTYGKLEITACICRDPPCLSAVSTCTNPASRVPAQSIQQMLFVSDYRPLILTHIEFADESEPRHHFHVQFYTYNSNLHIGCHPPQDAGAVNLLFPHKIPVLGNFKGNIK